MTRAAILAGGAASRLDGAAKGLLEVSGRRILDRIIDAVLAAFGELPLLVANAPNAGAWHPGLRVVADQRPGSGTLGGLYTAVVETPAPVVCVAWDMPFVSSALLERLAAGLEAADVCLPASDSRRGVEPLCAAYGPRCAEPMARAIGRGDYRAIAFHEAVRTSILSVDEVAAYGDPARLFFNVNTAEDLARANAMGG